MTSPALDSSESKAEIVEYDNGAWRDSEIFHYILLAWVWARRLGSPGEGEAEGRHYVALRLRLPLGLVASLENMERAPSWCYRGRAQHALLGRALSLACSKDSIEKASQRLEDVGGDGGDADEAGNGSAIRPAYMWYSVIRP